MDLPKERITCVGHPISGFGVTPSHPHEKLGDGSSCCGSDTSSAGILPTWTRPGDMVLLSDQHRPRELPWFLLPCTWRGEVNRIQCHRGALLQCHILGRKQ